MRWILLWFKRKEQGMHSCFITCVFIVLIDFYHSIKSITILRFHIRPSKKSFVFCFFYSPSLITTLWFYSPFCCSILCYLTLYYSLSIFLNIYLLWSHSSSLIWRFTGILIDICLSQFQYQFKEMQEFKNNLKSIYLLTKLSLKSI